MGMPTHIRLRQGYAGQVLRRLLTRVSTAAVALVVPVAAFAQGGGAFPVDSTYETISGWTLMIAQFLNIMTWFVFSFLIFLLDPRFIFDMTDGAEGSLMEALNRIWQLSRNLMNVGFAVGLVGAAIYTVVTANQEFVSKHLKTFVMAVILVNFSWFIPRVVLDISNVAAATIYSIPTAIGGDSSTCKYLSSNRDGCFEAAGPDADGMFTCACKAVADFKPFPGSKLSDDLKDADPTWQCYWAYCVRYVKLDASTATQHAGILNGLVINHARLSSLAIITRTDVDDDIADLLLFILREMIVIVINIALLFPLLALLVALIIRIPILWLTMAFMPFYFLSWVIPEELGSLGGSIKEKADKIWEFFLKAALLPAAVAVPLSIGFVMANAGSSIAFSGLSGIPFNLIDGMGSFAQLLWVLMVLGILWSGTFMVLELMTGDMPGGSIINTIKSTGEEAGKFAASLPLSTIPIPAIGGNLLSAAQMASPGGIRSATATLARSGPSGLFGGNPAARDAGKLATAAKKLSDADIAEFQRGIDATKANPDRGFDDLKKFFDKKLPETGIKLNEGNFKEHVLNLAKELERNGKTLDSLNSTIGGKSKFETEAAKVTPRPAGGPPAAP